VLARASSNLAVSQSHSPFLGFRGRPKLFSVVARIWGEEWRQDRQINGFGKAKEGKEGRK
jgi:hypothetical protein